MDYIKRARRWVFSQAVTLMEMASIRLDQMSDHLYYAECLSDEEVQDILEPEYSTMLDKKEN